MFVLSVMGADLLYIRPVPSFRSGRMAVSAKGALLPVTTNQIGKVETGEVNDRKLVRHGSSIGKSATSNSMPASCEGDTLVLVIVAGLPTKGLPLTPDVCFLHVVKRGISMRETSDVGGFPSSWVSISTSFFPLWCFPLLVQYKTFWILARATSASRPTSD
jgi:hypothetical protein